MPAARERRLKKSDDTAMRGQNIPSSSFAASDMRSRVHDGSQTTSTSTSATQGGSDDPPLRHCRVSATMHSRRASHITGLGEGRMNLTAKTIEAITATATHTAKSTHKSQLV